MKISNIDRMYAETEKLNSSVPSDPESKDVLNQISNAEKQLKDLAADHQLGEEEKQKKRKEIQQQITELNKRLRQHQIELRREQEEKKKELSALREEEENLTEEENETKGMSHSGLKAVISANSAISQAKAQGDIVSSMEGRVRVLQSEISQDERYGKDTESKQKELKKLEQKAVKVKGAKMSYLSRAAREMKEAAKKETQTDQNSVKSSGSAKAADYIHPTASSNSVAGRKTDIYIKGNMFSNVDFHF